MTRSVASTGATCRGRCRRDSETASHRPATLHVSLRSTTEYCRLAVGLWLNQMLYGDRGVTRYQRATGRRRKTQRDDVRDDVETAGLSWSEALVQSEWSYRYRYLSTLLWRKSRITW